MTRSDSSDSGRSRKHKRKSKRRSRSDSSSSEERSRKSRKHKSDRRKDDHRRSRSRERSRDRRRSRSRERKRSRTRSRERKRSRSRSRSKSPVKHHSTGWDETAKTHSSVWESKQALFKPEMDGTDDKLTLKEKIKLLTGKTNTETVAPSSEQLDKIESENFIQDKFSSTYIDPSAQPKQKKKKKNKQKQTSKSKDENIDESKSELDPVSHENAIFGNTMDTLHVSRFSTTTRMDGKRKEELKTIESEDALFGPIFFEDPELRMKRWVKKLASLRKKMLEEGVAID